MSRGAAHLPRRRRSAARFPKQRGGDRTFSDAGRGGHDDDDDDGLSSIALL